MTDVFWLLTPVLVLALVSLLAFAGCGLGHATVLTGTAELIFIVDFDPAVIALDQVELSITQMGPRSFGTRVITSSPPTNLAATGVLASIIGAGTRWDPGTCRVTIIASRGVNLTITTTAQGVLRATGRRLMSAPVTVALGRVSPDRVFPFTAVPMGVDRLFLRGLP